MAEQFNTNEKHSRIRYALVFAILTLIYVCMLSIVAYPYAVKNIETSNIKEHIDAYKAQKSKDTWTTVISCLYGINGPVNVERSIEAKGSNLLHTIIEAMLMPLSDEEIENGLLTYIPKKTELIGATESDNHIFVELSNDLLFSSNLNRAIEQIELTLETTMNPTAIYIIVDKEIIN